MKTPTLIMATVAAASAALGATPSPPPASDFSARVDNPWFPLEPGTRYVSVGVRDGQPARDVMTVTHRTTTIDGVPCVVVADRLYLRGRLAERTTDWYSQDEAGNVWYFGEDTAELDKNGKVTSTSGTWQAGANGARPGIFMSAHPKVGQSFQQEFAKGEAEDHFKVVAVLGANAVSTREWTPLEPGTLDSKTYVRGIGTILELTVKGGDERLELVSITKTR
jgi:hypothetical protein